MSTDTGVEERDTHLRQPRFLDADRFPHIRFRSTRVRAIGGPTWEVDGQLDLHGVRRPVTLAITDAPSIDTAEAAQSLTAIAKTSLDRHAFGMDYHGMSIGAEVTITLDMRIVRCREVR